MVPATARSDRRRTAKDSPTGRIKEDQARSRPARRRVGIRWPAGCLTRWALNRSPRPRSAPVLTPALAGVAVVALLAGWLTALGCRNMAASAAGHEREFAEGALRGRVTTVTRTLVLAPAGAELGAYEEFRRELALARGKVPVS